MTMTSKLEKRLYVLEGRVRRLRNKIAKKRGRCSHCGEAYHAKPKLADDGYVPGWLCAGGGTGGRY